jgi:hypothetical protein
MESNTTAFANGADLEDWEEFDLTLLEKPVLSEQTSVNCPSFSPALVPALTVNDDEYQAPVVVNNGLPQRRPPTSQRLYKLRTEFYGARGYFQNKSRGWKLELYTINLSEFEKYHMNVNKMEIAEIYQVYREDYKDCFTYDFKSSEDPMTEYCKTYGITVKLLKTWLDITSDVVTFEVVTPNVITPLPKIRDSRDWADMSSDEEEDDVPMSLIPASTTDTTASTTETTAAWTRNKDSDSPKTVIALYVNQESVIDANNGKLVSDKLKTKTKRGSRGSRGSRGNRGNRGAAPDATSTATDDVTDDDIAAPSGAPPGAPPDYAPSGAPPDYAPPGAPPDDAIVLPSRICKHIKASGYCGPYRW